MHILTPIEVLLVHTVISDFKIEKGISTENNVTALQELLKTNLKFKTSVNIINDSAESMLLAITFKDSYKNNQTILFGQ